MVNQWLSSFLFVKIIIFLASIYLSPVNAEGCCIFICNIKILWQVLTDHLEKISRFCVSCKRWVRPSDSIGLCWNFSDFIISLLESKVQDWKPYSSCTRDRYGGNKPYWAPAQWQDGAAFKNSIDSEGPKIILQFHYNWLSTHEP